MTVHSLGRVGRDTIMEILSFLPCRNILQYASVCREWLVICITLEYRVFFGDPYAEYDRIIKIPPRCQVIPFEENFYPPHSDYIYRAANCGIMHHLTYLGIHQPVARHGIEFREFIPFDNLTHLRVENGSMSDRQITHMIQHPMHSIRQLEMSRLKLKAHHLEQLATDPHKQELTHLTLYFNSLDGDFGGALASKGCLENLKHISIDGNRISTKGIADLVKADFASRLTFFSASCCDIKDEALPCITNSMQNLTHLDLSANEISDEGVRVLVENPRMGKIKKLVLDSCPITNRAVQYIAESEHMKNLSRLVIGMTEVNGGCFVSIAKSPHLTKLKHLDVDGCVANIKQLKLLLSSSNLASLTYLDMGYCRIGDEGLALIGSSPLLSNLKKLLVNNNDITDDGLKKFVQLSNPLPSLTCIDLFANMRAKKAVEILSVLKRLRVIY